MLEEQSWQFFPSPFLFTVKNRKEGGDSVPGQETADGPKGTKTCWEPVRGTGGREERSE